jgi:desulfoferrodoxin (superoxide reductase-like protein)
MTTALVNIQVTVAAVSHNTTDWHAIHWHKVHRNVRRLQARIVKATQVSPLRKRVFIKASERLELSAGKLARSVLRYLSFAQSNGDMLSGE